MSTLESTPDDGAAGADSTGTESVTVSTDDGDVTVSIPNDASAGEAAAITAAVGAHLSDRQRAAAAAAAQRETVDYTDQWTLAARLDRVGKRRRPRNVERGDEWKAAARARY